MMKKSFLNLLCIGCIACAFTACSDDDKSDVVDPGVTPVDREEDTAIQFRVSQANPGTYSYQGDEYGASDAESAIGSTVAVYIFDDDGIFEKSANLSVSGSNNNYLSDPLQISSGNKYIYVFANMGNTGGAVLPNATGMYRTNFEKEVVTATLATMTTPNSFYIGTLEPEIKSVPTGGTTASPVTVSVEVGRLAAKVKLLESTITVNDRIEGEFEFDEAQYRLINESKSQYLVGQPSKRIISSGNIMTSPHFTDTYPSSNIDGSAAWRGFIAVADSFYTKENTHSTPLNGTATSVQYKVKYVPDDKELYGLDGKSGAALDASGTFWRVRIGSAAANEYYLLNEDPGSRTSIPELGDIVGSAEKYEDGYAYYIIPIADNRESDPAAKYSVIRNHYYEMTIRSINRLGKGDPDDITEPEIPIGEDTVIVVDITVLPWFYIEQVVDL
ncbi:MAG: Mfa1 family fimbria major subunit [Tannerellaceae bacterium]|nr:Mfa1 family fimbria major subunit [Tannerellaceae bacterium]